MLAGVDIDPIWFAVLVEFGMLTPRFSLNLLQAEGNLWGKLQYSLANGLTADVEPALGQQILHAVIAQRKPEKRPKRIPNDGGRKRGAGG